jgi:Holliday junction resolvase RusA-like endonuclease
MTEVTFTVPGPPLSWKRARANGKRRFKDPKMQAYQMTVAGHALRALGRQRWISAGGEHGLEVHAFGRRQGAPGDSDNLCAKVIMDALEGLLWENDRSVTELHAYRKRVPPGSERLMVRAWVLPPPLPSTEPG